MIKILKYLKYVIRHKWFVLLECCKIGMPWRGLIHDMSKFLPSEFFPYAFHNWNNERDETGYYKPTDTGDSKFDFAWLLHQKRNRHHWQWWILPEDNGGVKILMMPIKYIKEMLCDWEGAHRAQKTKGNVKEWYIKNGNKMQLHPETRSWIDGILLGRYKL